MTIAETLKQEGLQQGLQQGRQEVAETIALRLLKRRLGMAENEARKHLGQLSVPQMEQLSEDLLDFRAIDDLIAWLEQHTRQNRG